MSGDPLLTARSLALLVYSGVLAPMRPDRMLGTVAALARYGLTPAAGYAAGAARHPDRPAIIDERGTVTYRQIHERSDRLARALADRGVGAGATVALLCRNHRGPIEAMTACAKLGADVVLLNTGLSAEQLAAVLDEQRADLVVADEEFTAALASVPDRPDTVLGWTDGEPGTPYLEGLIGAGGDSTLPARPPAARLIVLTSGTTGTPKGARRPGPKGLGPIGAILSRIPLRAGEPVLVAAPLFHTWGFAGLQLGFLLGAPLVLHRRFDPSQTLRAIGEHGVTTVVAVPVMLQRMLELPEAELDAADTRVLRVVAVSGSAVSTQLAQRFTERFGPVLYNLYGSTEVSWASIATPEDMRTAPGTVGRPPLGTTLRILDDDDRPAPDGQTGRIFIGNDMLFEGYTRSGAGTDVVDGLMGIGDVGMVDENGLLHVTGRSDDMIVSGGENVHPGQVEELTSQWPEVHDAAVLGIDDADFGQRLAAYLVLAPGAELDADTVRDRVRSKLARFAVPRDVHFVDELPRNATGKIDKKRLRRP
ncbi:MAG: AMP-binding protein [Pseudonocardiaceae bacterium]|nr:AMP-binding protein [Pseudonocardiaceae bacterium]